MSDFVHPEHVLAYKHQRLAPAFGDLFARRGEILRAHASDAESSRAIEHELLSLLEEWRCYESSPVDWLTAPEELERGLHLEARLAWLQSASDPATGAHRVGELLGMHTVADLKDLLASRRYVVEQLSTTASACTDWPARDPAAFAQWRARLDAANADFAKAEQ